MAFQSFNQVPLVRILHQPERAAFLAGPDKAKPVHPSVDTLQGHFSGQKSLLGHRQSRQSKRRRDYEEPV